VNAFLPASVTVHLGDTVRWPFPWFEPHSVTFGVPQSGAPVATPSPAVYNGDGFLTSELTFGPAPAFEVQFSAAGTFAYRCTIHPKMNGVVTVVPAGAAADTPASVDARGESEYRSAVDELKRIAADLSERPPAVNPLPGGVSETVVTIAGETAYGDTQLFYRWSRFTPAIPSAGTASCIPRTRRRSAPSRAAYRSPVIPRWTSSRRRRRLTTVQGTGTAASWASIVRRALISRWSSPGRGRTPITAFSTDRRGWPRRFASCRRLSDRPTPAAAER
jgi:plastocyanin